MRKGKIIKYILILIIFLDLLLSDFINVYAKQNDVFLIKQVEKYTSEFDEDKINQLIKDGEYNKARNLIMNTREEMDMRWDYNGLILNDLYIAYQFKEYMTSGFFSKGWLANVFTGISGLFYNEELKQYLSLQSPGKDKYKDMLKSFITQTQDEMICLEYSQLLCTGIKSIDEINDYIEKDTYDILYDMASYKSTKEEIDDFVLKIVENNPDFFSNEGKRYVFKNQLSEAFNLSSYGLDYIETTFEGFMDIQYICANRKVLEFYNDFLNNIQTAKNPKNNYTYIAPKDLRLAAKELQKELQGDISSIQKEVVNKLNFTTIEAGIDCLSIVNNKILNKISTGISLGVIIGNAEFDMKSLVIGVAHVQGFAYLGEIYSVVLQKDKKNFLKESSVENAQKFIKDYNILYQIRLIGEQTYQDMSDFSGVWEKEDQKNLRYWTDYEAKNNFCVNNIEMIKGFNINNYIDEGLLNDRTRLEAIVGRLYYFLSADNNYKGTMTFLSEDLPSNIVYNFLSALIVDEIYSTDITLINDITYVKKEELDYLSNIVLGYGLDNWKDNIDNIKLDDDNCSIVVGEYGYTLPYAKIHSIEDKNNLEKIIIGDVGFLDEGIVSATYPFEICLKNYSSNAYYIEKINFQFEEESEIDVTKEGGIAFTNLSVEEVANRLKTIYPEGKVDFLNINEEGYSFNISFINDEGDNGWRIAYWVDYKKNTGDIYEYNLYQDTPTIYNLGIGK